MNNPDVDTVLNYLSIKFNKIFCDREFVSCVVEDFQTILKHKACRCVLVFPTLGPTYLKALRYQARIFDLAVFSVNSASGRFRSLAVCHKEHLLKKTKDEVPVPTAVQTEMSSASRRKRPERQLYVPPAQRRSRLDDVARNRLEHNNNYCDDDSLCNDTDKKTEAVDCVYFNLKDVLISFYCIHTRNSGSAHRNCEFFNYLCFRDFISDRFLPRYDNLFLSQSGYKYLNWKAYSNKKTLPSLPQFKTFPIFDFNNDPHSEEAAQSHQYTSILISDISQDCLMVKYIETDIIDLSHRILCDIVNITNDDDLWVLDLSMINGGHFFIVPHEDTEFIYECQEQHDPNSCYLTVKGDLKNLIRKSKLDDKKTQNNVETTSEKNDLMSTTNDIIKINMTNENNTKNYRTEHEQEKEIMRKTKKNINRRTRPIMKYVDDANDLLKIDNKNDSVNNWEDLFDDEGEIQEELLTEIVGKVGDEVTIVTATEDYSDYMNKPPEDLEHVVELYNFPATLETHDLIQAFSNINSDAMYVKWVDDTHALLVLGSLSQAQKAIALQNEFIKARPMTAASSVSVDVANKSDLKPAMKRPETNLQTARRLITSHLGTKSRITKEQMAKEKEDLKNAREKKRMFKQSEKDAWEGNIRSSVN